MSAEDTLRKSRWNLVSFGSRLFDLHIRTWKTIAVEVQTNKLPDTKTYQRCLVGETTARCYHNECDWPWCSLGIFPDRLRSKILLCLFNDVAWFACLLTAVTSDQGMHAMVQHWNIIQASHLSTTVFRHVEKVNARNADGRILRLVRACNNRPARHNQIAPDEALSLYIYVCVLLRGHDDPPTTESVWPACVSFYPSHPYGVLATLHQVN